MGAWSYSFSPQPWSPEKAYIVHSSATDLAGNAQTAVSSVTFNFDVYQPTIAVLSPADGGYMNASQGASTGTVKDYPGAGISSLQVALSSSAAGAAGSWWNGAAFTGAAAETGYVAVATTSYSAGV
ncbi:MAG TPA: hypothetical protein P5069_17150, partial [Candidatus Hydrogenedentes bacterium]|nr:hypothetical protein [Candidatus Hydrogenedentota bacterium]